MSDGMLSQDQINALLKASQDTSEPVDQPGECLTDEEKDTLGELGNISMGSAATVLSTLLSKKVEITTPRVHCTTSDRFVSEYPIPCILVDVQYTEGLSGSNLLIFKEEDASIIADLMLGRDGTEPKELGDLEISAVAETMNQMMGSATTSMSSMLTRKIAISPPIVHRLNLGESDGDLPIEEVTGTDDVVEVDFTISIEDLIPSSQLRQLIPVDFAKQLVANIMSVSSGNKEVPAPAEEPQAVAASAPAAPAAPRPAQTPAGQEVYVEPAQFAQLQPMASTGVGTELDLILDVPLRITVELGRTELKIRQVLELGPGSIIELDKLAGEPVDVLVNGKLIAKGEVVVIDEDFGVKITDIVSQAKRVSTLAEGSS